MQSYDIALDMHKAAGRIERTVTVRKGDNDTQQIRASITAGGQPYTPKGTARLDIMHADGTWARCSASVSGSTATCTLPSAALNGAGRCRAAHFVFTDGSKVESTEGFALVIEGNVDTDGTPGAQGYDDALNALNDRLQEAEAERAEAEQGRVTAEQGRADAERARADAETARVSKEAERVSAEQGRVQAETARADAESKRAQAEQARASEESKRATAETERKRAEDGRESAETARESKETERSTAEDARKRAETERTSAEDARKQAETARANAETARASEESKRAQAESNRSEAETARSTAEQSRASKEDERIAAEAARVEAERARVAAEQSRSTAESARVAADEKRQTDQAKNNADQALNNEQMKKLSPVILQEGQYDRATLKPTVEGEPNRMYFVPMVAPAAIELYDLTQKQVEAGNVYVEWMWVGGKWEQMGQSEMKARPISTDQIDAVFAGEHPTGEDVLNLTGLDYFKGGADAAYAPTCFRGTLSSGDLNSITAPGAYKIDGGASIRNFPSGAYQWGVLVVAMADDEGQTGTQTYYAHQGGGNAGPFVRVRHGGSWRDWQRAEISGHKHGAADITSGTLSADRIPALPIAKVNGLRGELDGKQPKGEYAAKSHGHAVADVTGLRGELDGKAGASHSHGAGDITSGTLPIARGGTGGATAEAARAALGASSQADTDALRESLSQKPTFYSEERTLGIGEKLSINLHRMIGRKKGACLLAVYGSGQNAENALLWLINPHSYASVEKYKELGRYIYNDGNTLNVGFRVEDNEPVVDVTAIGVSQDATVAIVPMAVLAA